MDKYIKETLYRRYINRMPHKKGLTVDSPEIKHLVDAWNKYHEEYVTVRYLSARALAPILPPQK